MGANVLREVHRPEVVCAERRSCQDLRPSTAWRHMGWDGDDYQARFDRLASSGVDVHGEADLVCSLGPRSVLDAGCGTGRVAIELAKRRLEVVGVDADPSMLATARSRGPGIDFVEADLA